MIELENVAVTFDAADETSRRMVLDGVDLRVAEGQFALVIGSTGSGKTTLLQTIAGTISQEATVTGRVSVAGRNADGLLDPDLPAVVGFVSQDPASRFGTGTVEDELAHRARPAAHTAAAMRQRVEAALDLLGVARLRHRRLSELSGGEQQRVAIGALLTLQPSVLVLDEPTSALDPLAAEEVLAVLQRFVHDLGLTVILAEHRLERVAQYADQVILVPGLSQRLRSGTPEEIFKDSAVAPPVVELGRIAGWSPLPLSVRDARRQAPSLLARLPELPPVDPAMTKGTVLCRAANLIVSYHQTPVLRGVSMTLARGEIVALMGRNGAGKSTLLNTLAAQLRPDSGTVTNAGGRAGLVPQAPAQPESVSSVDQECVRADTRADLPPGTTWTMLQRLWPNAALAQHLDDLSAGQRLIVELARVLSSSPGLILLDEPTRGLDYRAKHRLAGVLDHLARHGHAVVLATHDVELVANVATRVMVIAEGEIVADGPTAEVVVSSPAYAPQVAKVLAPLHWLTPAQVAAAMSSSRGRPA